MLQPREAKPAGAELVAASMEKPTTHALTVVNFVTLIAAYLSLNTSLNLLNKVRRRARQPRRAPTARPHLSLCAASQWALGVYGFRFPFLLTSTHMAFSFLVLAPFAMRTPWETHMRTLEKQWKGIVYIGGFMALNIALNNISLLDISLSLNQVIRCAAGAGGWAPQRRWPPQASSEYERVACVPAGLPSRW